MSIYLSLGRVARNYMSHATKHHHNPITSRLLSLLDKEETEAQRKQAMCPRSGESETNYEPSASHRVYAASHRRTPAARAQLGTLPLQAATWSSHLVSLVLALQVGPLCPKVGALESSTDVPRFTALCKYCVFHKLEVCSDPTWSSPVGSIFPTAFAPLCPCVTL